LGRNLAIVGRYELPRAHSSHNANSAAAVVRGGFRCRDRPAASRRADSSCCAHPSDHRFGCAVLLALSSLSMFLAARTTVVPSSVASKLVTWGPYQFTRNPMYVSLVLAYFGAMAIFSQLLALFFLPLPIILVHKIVIPFEETRMREAFGGAYDKYCSRVRRWL